MVPTMNASTRRRPRSTGVPLASGRRRPRRCGTRHGRHPEPSSSLVITADPHSQQIGADPPSAPYQPAASVAVPGVRRGFVRWYLGSEAYNRALSDLSRTATVVPIANHRWVVLLASPRSLLLASAVPVGPYLGHLGIEASFFHGNLIEAGGPRLARRRLLTLVSHCVLPSRVVLPVLLGTGTLCVHRYRPAQRTRVALRFPRRPIPNDRVLEQQLPKFSGSEYARTQPAYVMPLSRSLTCTYSTSARRWLNVRSHMSSFPCVVAAPTRFRKRVIHL